MTETRPVGWLSRTLQRLTADDQTIDAEELRAESASAGCEPLSSCRKGAVVTVTGPFGLNYSPLSDLWSESTQTDINFMMVATRD